MLGIAARGREVWLFRREPDNIWRPASCDFTGEIAFACVDWNCAIFLDGDTLARPCVSRRTSVAHLAVMTSWRGPGTLVLNLETSLNPVPTVRPQLIDRQRDVWLVTNNRLAVARVAYCEVGNRCNGKLICYRDCLISLPPAFILFLFILQASFFRSYLVVNCKEPVFVI